MNLPALPMGTIMAVCMIITVLFTNTFPKGGLNRLAPRALNVVAGVVALAAGLWNGVWHALRHLNSDWGQMALGSGLLMLLCSAFLLFDTRLPPKLQTLRLPAAAGLALFAFGYAWKIAHL